MKHLLPALVFVFSVLLHGQSETNLFIFKQFADSAMRSVRWNDVQSEKPEVAVTLPAHALILEPHIREQLQFALGLRNKIFYANKKEKVLFTLESAELTYPELFRDGLMGEYFISRKFQFKGSISLIDGQGQTKFDFSFNKLDTLQLEQKDSVELAGYALTQKELPEEPVFRSLLEPVTVVAALALTVYLFFTTRSSQ